MSPAEKDLFAAPADDLTGTIERVTFHNPANGFTVARLSRDGVDDLVAIVGTMTEPHEGECYRLRGKWMEDPQWGRQFRFDEAHAHVPTTLEGLERFLGSGFVKGMGPKIAERIVARFGEQTIEVLDRTPERLREIEGIGRRTLLRITDGWAAKRHLHETMAFLQGLGMTPNLAAKIHRTYGDRAAEIVRANPYRLARDIERVGFKRADAIAQNLGFPHDAPERAEAAVLYLLARGADAGHCYLTYEELQEQGAELLGTGAEVVQHAVRTLHEEEFVRGEKVRNRDGDERNAVYPIAMWRHEREVAKLLQELADSPKLMPRIETAAAVAAFEEEHRFRLAPRQREAVETALRGGLVIITGGPGTGKTTIVRAILKIMVAHGGKVLLAAPTGRAARRLSESAHAPAATIHRLLNFDPQSGKFVHNAANPLKANLVIVDESSMIDVPLAASLLAAIPSTTGVLFVGDIDQLPSVGAGDFLHDTIASGIADVVRLDEVYRQERQSLIVRNAHRVNHGEFPYLNDGPAEERAEDFFFIEKSEPEEVRQALVQLISERIPKKYRFHPLDDVQVLAPMHKNVLGTAALNELMQTTLNGSNPAEYIGAGVALREGDKLMQVRNNYDLDVFNGDIGRLKWIDRKERRLHVDFDGRVKSYTFEEVDQLALAYAISVHKSQGSEYKAVVLVLHGQHHIMLQRNLLYTALTRARELVVIIGTKKALGTALRNTTIRERHTALAWRLRKDRARTEPTIERVADDAGDFDDADVDAGAD